MTNVDLVPSADARNGILHNKDGTTTTVVVDPLVQPFLGFYPLPNSRLVGLGDTGHYEIATNNTSHVLGGWELGGIFTAETGVPFTPLIGGDPLGTNSSDPYAFPNRLTGPGCADPIKPGNVSNYVKLNCFAVPAALPAIAAQCSPYSPVPGSCSNLMATPAAIR